MIEVNNERLSVRAQSRLLDLNRSSLYYQEKPLEEDTEIANRIAEIYEATPQYGYRRIHAQLVREGTLVNHKKVHRLMKELRLKAIYPRPKTTIGGRQSQVYPYLLSNMTIKRPHQVWATDITYLKLPGGFVYLTALIDLYSRVIVGWRLSNSLCKESSLEALEDGVWRYGCPKILNSDQGAQFTSEEWSTYCKSHDIQISMSHKGGSTDNAHIERFWRTLKFEGVYLNFPQTMAELKAMLSDFIRWYNEERLHSALDYQTPMEVLKMADDQTYGNVENFNKFPTVPQVQLQQQPFLYGFIG